MRRLILIAVLVMLGGVFACAMAEETSTPPAPPVPDSTSSEVHAEMLGTINVTILPPIKVISVKEKAADFEPDTGYAAGMAGSGMAYQSMMTDGFGKLFQWMQAGNHPTGPAMAAFYEDPEKTAAKDLTCKVMFPVGADAKATGDLMIEDLPEMQAAVVQYKGPYEGATDVWNAVGKWITDNGYESAGAPMEVYLKSQGDNVPPSEYLTEIRWPVKKAEKTEPKN